MTCGDKVVLSLIFSYSCKEVMLELRSPILSIPGISYTLGAVVLAANTTPMVKGGSTYLRWVLLNAARLVAMRDETFKDLIRRSSALIWVCWKRIAAMV